MESKNKKEPSKDNDEHKICKEDMDSKSLIEKLNAKDLIKDLIEKLNVIVQKKYQKAIRVKDLIEKLNAKRQQEKQKAIQFKDLEVDKWYKILDCSNMIKKDYEKYFIMTLESIENGEIIKVFSLPKLIPKYKYLVGNYIEYSGKKENKSGEYSHDYTIIDQKYLNIASKIKKNIRLDIWS